MIPYHQLHKPSETDRALRGDYDGQGKSAARETRDSMIALVEILAYIGVVLAVVLLSMPLWWE